MNETDIRCSSPLSDLAPKLGHRFHQALVMAAQLHASQRRKVNQVPYISHLLSVAALVLEDGGDEDEAIAALLHDAVEDQGGLDSRLRILHRFGTSVVEIVDGCTEPERLPGEPWQHHKQRYLSHVQNSSSAVHRVVLADKLHNGRSLLVNLRQYGDMTWRCFQGTPFDILWFHQSVVEAFRCIKPGWMLDELTRIVRVLESQVSSQV